MRYAKASGLASIKRAKVTPATLTCALSLLCKALRHDCIKAAKIVKKIQVIMKKQQFTEADKLPVPGL